MDILYEIRDSIGQAADSTMIKTTSRRLFRIKEYGARLVTDPFELTHIYYILYREKECNMMEREST